MNSVPQRLRKDSIIEALFELRFKTPEIPEILIGKIVSAVGSGMTLERLPMADLPPPIRKSDPNLAFQPTLQLRKENLLARVGDQSFSWHVLPPYPGWEAFKQAFEPALQAVISQLPTASVVRLGLRYLNVLNEADHQVSGVEGMNLTIEVGGKPLSKALNLNYRVLRHGQSVTVRIASPEFVQGGPARDLFLMIDVDVSTEGAGSPPPLSGAAEWVENAHTNLKKEFFGLWKPDILERLMEKQDARHDGDH